MSDLRALLRNRGFLGIWSAAVVSGLGDKIAVIALYLLVYRLAGRAVDLGLLAAVQILPAVLLGPVAGLILDRCDRRRVMILCDLASAIVAAAIPFAPGLTAVYALAALLSAGRQIAGPARLALLPDLLPGAQLSRSNGLMMVTQNVVLLAGPALGGAVVALRGTSAAFWLDAASFVASAALLWASGRGLARGAGAREAAAPVPAGLAGAWSEIRRAAAWLCGQPRLRFSFFFLGAVAFVTAMQQPLVVVFVKQVLGRGDVDLGLILSAAGLGGIVGAVIGGTLTGVRNPLRNVTWLTAIDGLALVLFALNRSFGAALVLFGLFGALGTAVQINLATFLQTETPEEKRGRVFGWIAPLLGPLSLLSVCAGPLAADAIGAVPVLALSGAVELAAGLIGRALLPAAMAVGVAAAGATAGAATPGEAREPAAMRGEA